MMLVPGAIWAYNQFQKAPKDNILTRLYDMSPESYAFDKQSAFAEKMAIDAFEREANYNSPAAQMARYEEAGLNPNLIYGQGTPGNVSASAPSATHAAPKLPGSGAINMVNTLMQVAGFLKEMQVKDAQINSLNVRSSQGEAGTLLSQERLKQIKDLFPHQLTKLVNEVGMQPAQLDAMMLSMDKDKQAILNMILGRELTGENITRAKNLNELFPIQKEGAKLGNEKMNEVINNLIRSGGLMTKDADIKDQIKAKMELEKKLLEAQTKFASEGITNPQAFFQFLISSIITMMR